MPNNRNGGSGGIKGTLITGIIFLIIAGLVIGWAKINNISDIKGVYDYFHSVSDKISSCGANHLQWNCNNPIDNNNSSDNGNNNTTNPIDASTPNNTTSQSSNKPNPTNSNPSNNTNNNSNIDPNNLSKETLLKNLDSIKSNEGSKDAFNSKDWNYWSGQPCSTRDKILIRDGKNVKVDDPKNNCLIVSGNWNSIFDNKTFTNPDDVIITNVIPLEYANAHGASTWDNKKKEKFANDLRFIKISSLDEQKKMEGKGPSNYTPSNKDFKCSYTKMWIDEAFEYNLTLTEKDKITLENNLSKC